MAAVAVVGIAIMQGSYDAAVPPRDGNIRVVSVSEVPAIGGGAGPVATATAPARSAAPSVDRLLAEGPGSLRTMHDGIARHGRDDRAAIDEARLRGVFTIAALPGLTDLSIACAARRCEVHGIADGDDTTTRLALRDPGFQDRLAALGYTAGSDLIAGRGTRSELLVYVERSD